MSLRDRTVMEDRERESTVEKGIMMPKPCGADQGDEACSDVHILSFTRSSISFSNWDSKAVVGPTYELQKHQVVVFQDAHSTANDESGPLFPSPGIYNIEKPFAASISPVFIVYSR